MPLSQVTREAVLQAVAEFDVLGREQFLSRYRYGRANTYFLAIDGKLYDSKAIMGVAYRFTAVNRSPLQAADFSGGESTVGRHLTRLGFQVERAEHPMPLVGESITNQQLMHAFQVGMMGGMRRSRARNHLVLVSDGTKSLYDDRWDGEVLHYTGMGKVDDQKFKSQNRTLAEAREQGITVHLFEVFAKNTYTYAGEVELAAAPYWESQRDDEGHTRRVIMFPLQLLHGNAKPTVDVSALIEFEHQREKKLARKSTTALRQLAEEAGGTPQRRAVRGEQIIRNPAIVAYVKQTAAGRCDLCGDLGPFKKSGRYYLECHHILPLAKDGKDAIHNAVALCPNCHRKMHALSRRRDLATLRDRVIARDQPNTPSQKRAV